MADIEAQLAEALHHEVGIVPEPLDISGSFSDIERSEGGHGVGPPEGCEKMKGGRMLDIVIHPCRPRQSRLTMQSSSRTCHDDVDLIGETKCHAVPCPPPSMPSGMCASST
jgi:hypothetical protein